MKFVHTKHSSVFTQQDEDILVYIACAPVRDLKVKLTGKVAAPSTTYERASAVGLICRS